MSQDRRPLAVIAQRLKLHAKQAQSLRMGLLASRDTATRPTAMDVASVAELAGALAATAADLEGFAMLGLFDTERPVYPFEFDQERPVPAEASTALDAAIERPLYRAGDLVRAAKDIECSVIGGPAVGNTIGVGEPGEVVGLSNDGVLIHVRFTDHFACLVKPDEIEPRSTKCPTCGAIGCQCDCNECETARLYPTTEATLNTLDDDLTGEEVEELIDGLKRDYEKTA